MAVISDVSRRLEEFLQAASVLGVLIPAQSLCSRLERAGDIPKNRVLELLDLQKKVAATESNKEAVQVLSSFSEKLQKESLSGTHVGQNRQPSSGRRKPKVDPRLLANIQGTPCLVSSCSERPLNLKEHVFKKHLPSVYCITDSPGDLSDDYLHTTRAIGLKWLAKWIKSTDSIDDLLDMVNEVGVNNILLGGAVITEVEQQAMRFLCVKQDWPLPPTFLLYPRLNSKAVLIHWKVLLFLLEHLQTVQKRTFLNGGDAWYSQLGLEVPPKYQQPRVDASLSQRNRGQTEYDKESRELAIRRKDRSPSVEIVSSDLKPESNRRSGKTLSDKESQSNRSTWQKEEVGSNKRKSRSDGHAYRSGEASSSKELRTEHPTTRSRRHGRSRRRNEHNRSPQTPLGGHEEMDEAFYVLCPAEGCDHRSTYVRKHAYDLHIPSLYDPSLGGNALSRSQEDYVQSRKAAGLRTLALWLTGSESLDELVRYVNRVGKLKCCLEDQWIHSEDSKAMRELCRQQGWKIQRPFKLYPELNSPAVLLYWRVLLWLMDLLTEEQRASFMYGGMDEEDWGKV